VHLVGFIVRIQHTILPATRVRRCTPYQKYNSCQLPFSGWTSL